MNLYNNLRSFTLGSRGLMVMGTCSMEAGSILSQALYLWSWMTTIADQNVVVRICCVCWVYKRINVRVIIIKSVTCSQKPSPTRQNNTSSRWCSRKAPSPSNSMPGGRRTGKLFRWRDSPLRIYPNRWRYSGTSRKCSNTSKRSSTLK